jgi:hypothetical protein
MLGRLQQMLVDGERPAGWNRVTLSASRLAPGMYLCRMEAEGVTLTRTLLVTR